MIASGGARETLGIEEVMNILDEASQVRAYSRKLEEKSQALQAATEDCAPPTSACRNSTG